MLCIVSLRNKHKYNNTLVNSKFKLYGSNIEIVESYSYLGLTFNYKNYGKFTLAKKKLAEHAQKAVYSLSKTRNLNILNK